MKESPLQNILKVLAAQTIVGHTGTLLNKSAEALIRMFKCEPAFLGYKDFPATMCVSINNEVIHGIPDDRKFAEGDLVKLDIGLKDANGDYDDGAITVLVGGRGSAAARKILRATKEALEAGIAAAKPGKTTHDIARAISAVAEREELAVIEGYGGHGIGKELHMAPHIPNEVTGEPEKLEVGMRLAIEPMFSTKNGKVVVAENKWTVKLAGGGIAAHFERTIEI